jgi:ketosteroid isomerase-like protein
MSSLRLCLAFARASLPSLRAATTPSPADDDLALVEQTIRDSIGWAATKDRPLLDSLWARDQDLFLYHPDSRSTVRGWEEFTRNTALFMDPRFEATRFDVRDLRIHRSRAGDVAWFHAMLDDCWRWDGGEEDCWRDTRWTGVLERRDGRWVIVQMHFSFAEDAVRAEAARSTEGDG